MVLQGALHFRTNDINIVLWTWVLSKPVSDRLPCSFNREFVKYIDTLWYIKTYRERKRDWERKQTSSFLYLVFQFSYFERTAKQTRKFWGGIFLNSFISYWNFPHKAHIPKSESLVMKKISGSYDVLQMERKDYQKKPEYFKHKNLWGAEKVLRWVTWVNLCCWQGNGHVTDPAASDQ